MQGLDAWLTREDPPSLRQVGPTLSLKARKRHSCHECCSAILPGQTYFRTVYQDDEGNFCFTTWHQMRDDCPALYDEEAW